jgi:hypothetical protein
MFQGATKEIKLKLYFGHLLISDAVTAIGKIKQFHNRYFVPPGELASGKNMSAMYKAMKRQLLKVYSQEQGYNTLCRKNEWKTGVWSLEEKASKMEAYREKKISEWEEKGDIVFVPDYWLTFLLCSFPMEVYFPGKKMTLGRTTITNSLQMLQIRHQSLMRGFIADSTPNLLRLIHKRVKRV